MPTDTDIANMALGHIGVKTQIASLLENSAEGIACRTFFETVRQDTLREFAWPFASKVQALALIQDNYGITGAANPPYEYRYIYQIPSDLLRAWRILSGFRQDTRQSRVPYKIVGNQIFSDWTNAYLEYTILPSDDSKYPPDFALAMSYKLAYFIIPSLSAGDPYQKSPQMIAFYETEIGKAKSSALNEQQVEQDVQSEFVRVRWGSDFQYGVQPGWSAFPVGTFIQ